MQRQGEAKDIRNQLQKQELQEKSKQLEQLLEGMGASFVGFSDVVGKLKGNLQPLHHAVTVGIRLSDAIIDEISDKPTFTYFHHYRTVNSLLDQIALRGLLFLQQQGFLAVAVPASQTVHNQEESYSGIFPHKTAAVSAGLGRIGRNGLFIHELYGPRVRLATILTDMPVLHNPNSDSNRPDQSVNKPQHNSCENCNLCVKACPAIALTGKDWQEGMSREELVDAKACSDYMNQKFKQIGRGSVCGICIKVCPVHGKNIKRYS